MKLVKFKVQNFRGLKGEHNEIQFYNQDSTNTIKME